MKFKFLSAFCVLMLGLASQAKAITNGVVISPDQAPFVVMVEDRTMHTVGTGVVVGPGVILTAEHCIPSKDTQSLYIDGKPVVTQILLPKDDGGNIRLDLALLSVDASLFPAYTPVFSQSPSNAAFDVEIIGYGFAYRPGTALELDESTILRKGRNRVQDPARQINSSYINIYFEHGPQDERMPSGALPGDSGGPMLIGQSVIGIGSKSVFNTSNYVNLTGARAHGFLESASKQGFQIQFERR